jgi:hypothetical protein
MSKSKYNKSNLYMTTREFANLVIRALDDQKYFSANESAHPGDIAAAFSIVGETIATAMSWAISQESDSNKNAIMQSGDLQKNETKVDIQTDGYSEWKFKK